MQDAMHPSLASYISVVSLSIAPLLSLFSLSSISLYLVCRKCMYEGRIEKRVGRREKRGGRR
jgi:hypothetical protein